MSSLPSEPTRPGRMGRGFCVKRRGRWIPWSDTREYRTAMWNAKPMEQVRARMSAIRAWQLRSPKHAAWRKRYYADPEVRRKNALRARRWYAMKKKGVDMPRGWQSRLMAVRAVPRPTESPAGAVERMPEAYRVSA